MRVPWWIIKGPKGDIQYRKKKVWRKRNKRRRKEIALVSKAQSAPAPICPLLLDT